MGMKVADARNQVLEQIEAENASSGLGLSIGAESPDGDPGKFVIEGKPARVIHPWNGFFAKINLSWLEGSTNLPEINRGEFYWYVFALEGETTGQVSYYYICDYMQLREFVMDFDAPKRNAHQDHADWRGEIHLLGERQGYFRWGDEDSAKLDRPWRIIELNNLSSYLRQKSEFDSFINDYLPSELVADLQSAKESLLELERTERETVIRSRLGQGRFRDDLVDYWSGCAVTGCQEFRILRASHIKPWRTSTNEERLDPFNGLLLMAHLDLAFDQGLITINFDGSIVPSDLLDRATFELLGLNQFPSVRKIVEKHRPFLAYHHQYVFKHSVSS